VSFVDLWLRGIKKHISQQSYDDKSTVFHHYHVTTHGVGRLEVSDPLIFTVQAEEPYVYFLSQVAYKPFHLFAVSLVCDEETVLDPHVIQVASGFK
jgi:hypothetical protein